ncbi:MAG: hypothetical protein C5B60_00285, partial [Chloroflexi bacterium]
TPETGVDKDALDPAEDRGRVDSNQGGLMEVAVGSQGRREHLADPVMTTRVVSVACGGRVLR